ncbi:monocarboxylate transporter 2 [Ixodes scapularis]|uniref:monocarboxylate transporter 2 n=1 Tax=Ixodes scapularis TaxID=6945 RepID=UPI001AD677D0|nr:monocarboxylate transporter 2 [Ixodes scapularis]
MSTARLLVVNRWRTIMPTVITTPLGAVKSKQNIQNVDTCWHVAVITFLILFVATVSLKNSGFILVGLMDEFDTDREHASWPTTVRVTFSLGAGFGMGAMYVTTALALFKYFDKYKSFANGLARAGETAAGIVFPPVFVFLQETYGFRGTLFIYGALALHATVLCLLLKEPPWTVRKPPLKTINKTDVFTTHSVNMANNQNEPPKSKSLHSSDLPDNVSHLLTMFRNPYFYLIVLCSVVVHISQFTFLTTIVDFAMDGGSSLADASSVITYISPADFIGRMILPLLADRNYIRRGTLVTLSFCVMGVSTMALPQTTSFATLLPTCVVFGIALGCLLTMEIVLVSDYVDVQLFAVCYGFCSLASIPGILVGPLVFGFFRDSMGTYDNMYRLIGGTHLAVSLIFGAVVCNEKRSGRPEQTTKL